MYLPIIYIALLVICIFYSFSNKKNLSINIVATILITGFGVFGTLISWLLAEFFYPNESWSANILAAGLIVADAAVLYLIWSKKHRKLIFIPMLCAALLCILQVAGVVIYHVYDDSIPVVGDGNDVLYYYKPWLENTKAVSLPEESSLKIDSDFPSFDGATALYPVYAAFAKAIYPAEVLEDEHILVCTTTTTAYEKIINGDVDMIFVASASKAQAEAAAAKGVELTFTPIGREAFVFFVNSKNPLDNITVEQIQDIYSGKIKEWSGLGVKRFGNIRAFQRDEGSGSQTALQKLMGDIPLMEPLMDDRISGMGEIINQTADYKNYRNSIGFSFRFYSTEMVKNNQIKLLSINGIYPNRENIINNTYPICAQFYAVTTQNSNPKCAEIIKWILSEQGQYIIEETGYVGIGN